MMMKRLLLCVVLAGCSADKPVPVEAPAPVIVAEPVAIEPVIEIPPPPPDEAARRAILSELGVDAAIELSPLGDRLTVTFLCVPRDPHEVKHYDRSGRIRQVISEDATGILMRWPLLLAVQEATTEITIRCRCMQHDKYGNESGSLEYFWATWRVDDVKQINFDYLTPQKILSLAAAAWWIPELE